VPKTLKPVDAVTIGVGWTGGIVARELTRAGLNVVGLERGDFRTTAPDFLAPAIHDELAYVQRNRLIQDPSRNAITMRNNVRETALPMRKFGAFLPGEGVGGAGVHWGGQTWRFLESDFQIRSHNVARYGADVMGEDCISQDWGVTYRELEPYYDRFEYLAGISGKAGNLNGKKIAGGNVFEGPRKRDYPLPPLSPSYSMELFREAALGLGFHPFITPAAQTSRPYKNPEGVQMGACSYCGFCVNHGCEMSAKGSLQTALLPVLLAEPRFELRCNAQVLKINVDSTGKRATGVTYIDASGAEVFQPAELVFLTAFALNNVHLLLLSGIGAPYDPATGAGLIGKHYSYQSSTFASVFFEGKHFNPFMGAGGLNMSFDDYNGDNFDHSGLGFIGGGVVGQGSGAGRPIGYHPTPRGTPRWGSTWKAAAQKYYQNAFSWVAQASVQSYRGNYLDLDPAYTNVFGQPLLRMTFDWGPHERKYSDWVAAKFAPIVQALNPQSSAISPLSAHFDSVPYGSTHCNGGAIMGTDPAKSAVNTHMQVWDVPNLFVMGASAFPQNAGYNPTGTVGALAYRTTDAVTSRYLKNPGLLG
jgi:gluconate 2-dehydrogenase alpha chain